MRLPWPRPLFRDGSVHPPPQGFLHLAELRTQPHAHRLAQYHELSVPRLAAQVREAEEVECLRFLVATAVSVPAGEPTELDEPCFVRMQLKAELPEALPQLDEELLCLLAMLEAHHEVIGEAHDDDVASRPLLPPLMDPQVEYVVQVDVGE